MDIVGVHREFIRRVLFRNTFRKENVVINVKLITVIVYTHSYNQSLVKVPNSTKAICWLLHSKNKNHVLVNALPILGVKRKRGWYVFSYFFKIGECSAISFKRSRRELSTDVAEHRSILNKYQNTRCLKQVYQSPKRGFCFYCVSQDYPSLHP